MGFFENFKNLFPNVDLEDPPDEPRDRTLAKLERERDGNSQKGNLEGPQNYSQARVLNAGQSDVGDIF